jgi:eukaryotic-like serine/threonine-protein kinase
VPAQISKTAELIAGYSLQERIGSGGYGEVWRAEAPGGLLKAIKFIYGRFDEERASCELKSLHRIKEVRHPFLLSLERIEVVDGQLVIVTELADASISDRFEACKAAGLPGIPREELLLYLHDAADALDYMSEHFLLQHLDIKPENLLILGGRVKVADFGLVKDVQDVTVSLMGGMTPVYAAPEVFEGHPSLQSDQYSLAIVYQEMLSGILPFPGKTPAQLTNQHLHGHPRLTPLPPGDRPIVTRALDKDPQQRFGSCRALIEALQKATNVEPAVVPPPPKPKPEREIHRTITLSNAESSCDTEAHSRRKESLRVPPEPESASGDEKQSDDAQMRESEVFDRQEPHILETSNHDSVAKEVALPDRVSEEFDTNMREKFNTINSVEHFHEASLPLIPPPPVFENLPAWEQPFTEISLRPTFFIGVGGTAGRVLQHLELHWQEHFENLDEIPIFQSLFFDTDPQAIGKMSSSADPACRHIESELLPLKRHEDYRDQAEQLTRWLGHRWIYNIPRSLHTEGLRPLGRLALIDNAAHVTSRIRKVLKIITSPASLEASAEKTNIPITESAPLIYIIASISGGTGSGMILDMAFAVRQALSLEGITSARICGLLLHGTPRHTAEKKLAIANSYACLSELHTYQQKYPGEAAWALSAAEKGVKPFDDTYFMHLGDDLGDTQFNAATERIAEYLHLDTTTACRSFFEQCRTASPSAELPPSQDWSLRSMGLSRLGFTPDDIPSADIESLCRNLVDYWRQSPNELALKTPAAGVSPPASSSRDSSPSGKTDSSTSSRTSMAMLDFENLCGKVEEIVHEQIHSSDETVLQETLDKTYRFAPLPEVADSTANRAQKALEVLFTTVQSLSENSCVSSAAAEEPILLPLRKLAEDEGVALRMRIVNQLNDSEGGLPGLQKTIDELLLDLHEREQDACQRQDRLRTIITQAELLLLPDAAVERKSLFQRLFTRGKQSPMTACWNDYSRWRLELVALHGQRYLWHALHAALTEFNEQLREMRQELLAISQEFQRVEPLSKTPEADGSWAFQSLLKNSWQELLRKHQRVLVGKLEHRLRGTILSGYLSAEGPILSKNPSAMARAESLRNSVRHQISNLLQEIDLAGLVLSSNEPATDESSPLKMVLDHAKPPLHSNYGGAQRLLLACPAGRVMDTIKQKIESAVQITPSIARTSSTEIVFCYEVERVPPLRIAAQLLENQSDCREIAAKLRSRIDVSWPRDF